LAAKTLTVAIMATSDFEEKVRTVVIGVVVAIALFCCAFGAFRGYRECMRTGGQQADAELGPNLQVSPAVVVAEFQVTAQRGVAWRNSPCFDDRNTQRVGPCFGDRVVGEVVVGEHGQEYLGVRTRPGLPNK